MKKKLDEKIELYPFKVSGEEKVQYSFTKLKELEMMINNYEVADYRYLKKSKEWVEEVHKDLDNLLSKIKGNTELESLEILIILLQHLKEKNDPSDEFEFYDSFYDQKYSY